MIVACALAVVPMACDETDSGTTDASSSGNGSGDGSSVRVPDMMTGG
jgi:hypothetical protein